MSDMDDLAAWLDRILKEEQAEAEAAAKVYGADWITSEHSDTVNGAEGGYVACGPYDCGLDEELRYFIARHDPASVLARIAADRQILALHQPDRPRATEEDDWGYRKCAGCGWQMDVADGSTLACPTVRLLALPHADRPGYQEAWRP